MNEVPHIITVLNPEKIEKDDQVKKRDELIVSLKEGLHVRIENTEVTFTAKFVPNDQIQVIVTSEENEVAAVIAHLTAENRTAIKLGKRYEDEDDPTFQKKGIITLALAYLFQYLIDMGVETVKGSILKTNARSLRNRLRVPDLIQVGFFSTTIEQDHYKPNSFLVRTSISPDSVRLSESIDEALLIQSFRNKQY